MSARIVIMLFLVTAFLVTRISAEPDIHHVYHNYEELTGALTNLSNKYPELTDLYSIGQSVEGRHLWVLAISGRNPWVHEVLRPEVKYVGNIHGNEAVGREILLHFAEELLTQYSADENVKTFLDETRIHIVPTMNPDGFEVADDQDCSGATGRSNANGKDLNRDFPDYFQPDNVERQAETIAIMDWLKTEQFVLSANLHGGALLVNYPYDNMAQEALSEYRDVLDDPAPYSASPDDDILRFLALTYSHHHLTLRNFTATMCGSDDPKSGFLDGITNGADWYAVKGGMQDYNYFEAACFEMTLELSCCKYPPESELPEFWEQNKDALYEYLRQVHRGVKGQVMDVNGPVKGATVKIDDRLVGRTTTREGEYWYILLPGSYRVQVSKEGYETQVRTAIVEGGLYNTAIVDFQLENGVSAIVPSIVILVLITTINSII